MCDMKLGEIGLLVEHQAATGGLSTVLVSSECEWLKLTYYQHQSRQFIQGTEMSKLNYKGSTVLML